MTRSWVKLDYARVLAARKLLAARGKKGEYIQKYVDAAEIILSGQVEENSAVEGMEGRTVSFPNFLSREPTVVLTFLEDFINANHEVDIADEIGQQVFEAISGGSLPRTAAELQLFTKSPY